MTDLAPIDSAHTALLVLDMHAGVAGSDGPAQHALDQNVVQHIAQLLDAARSSDVEVIHAHHRSAVGVRPGGQVTPLFAELAELPEMQDDAPEMAIVAGLEPRPGEIIVHKQRVSAFMGTELDLVLRAGAISTLILTGTYTNLSVESTARYAADLGYRVVLASDSLCSVSAEWHNAALAHGLSMLCDVATTDEVLAALAFTH